MPDPKEMILVVDRPDGPLQSQESILARRDRVVVMSASGADALEILRRDMPRLVVLSYDLGDRTAPEFCREVRDDEQLRGTSLLFVGERGASAEVDLCMAAGCNDVILLPIRGHELNQKIARLANVPVRQKLRTLTKIDLTVAAGESFRLGHSLNISSSGMLVEVDEILPPESKLRVQFYLRGENVPLQLTAEVVRADFSRAGARYGLRFVSARESERKRIESFVERMRSREQN